MHKHCNACGGRYLDPQPDGSRFYHVCGTEILVTVTREGATIEIPLPTMRSKDVEISRREAVRSNRRDETVIDQGPDGPVIKSEGAGVLAADTLEALDALVFAATIE